MKKFQLRNYNFQLFLLFNDIYIEILKFYHQTIRNFFKFFFLNILAIIKFFIEITF